MCAMNYAGDLARIQRALSQSHDLIARRATMLQALNLRVGERVLELGCGGGFAPRKPPGSSGQLDASPPSI